jgi:hypothetical protein
MDGWITYRCYTPRQGYTLGNSYNSENTLDPSDYWAVWAVEEVHHRTVDSTATTKRVDWAVVHLEEVVVAETRNGPVGSRTGFASAFFPLWSFNTDFVVLEYTKEEDEKGEKETSCYAPLKI